MFPLRTYFEQKTGRENNVRLTLAYDGTDFHGWQVQPGLPTIQGELEAAIEQVTGERVLPQGSGRTDTGVHAAGQVVSVSLQADIPAERLLQALNRRLPPAIRVLAAVSAPAAFHARAAVLHKTYEYRIFERLHAGSNQERICLPGQARYVWDCPRQLRLDAMQHAAEEVRGTHDFTSFAAADPDRAHRLGTAGSQLSNTRTIYRSAWQRRDDLLVYRVTGTGFLHHMVRNIVGTCVEVGVERMDPGMVPQILQARDRRRAGPTAPPQGLHLMHVLYAGDTGSDPTGSEVVGL